MLVDPSVPKAPVYESFVHEVNRLTCRLHDMYITFICYSFVPYHFNSVEPEHYNTELFFFPGISERYNLKT